MDYVRLGKTDLLISRVAFGAMRLTTDRDGEDAAIIVRRAYDAGINFFDTSAKTPVSEKVLGDALYDIKRNVFLSTATAAKSGGELAENLENSLMNLHSDYVDLYQVEAEDFLPVPGGNDKIYDILMQAKEQGKIKHIGLVTTNADIAKEAVEKELFETIQFPFNILSQKDTEKLVKNCYEKDIGFIAMQPLGGGLVENIPLAFGFLSQYEDVVPIWGVKSLEQMEQILYFYEHPPVIDDKFNADVEKIRSFFN